MRLAEYPDEDNSIWPIIFVDLKIICRYKPHSKKKRSEKNMQPVVSWRNYRKE